MNKANNKQSETTKCYRNTRIVKTNDEKIDLNLNPSIEYTNQDKTIRNKNMKCANRNQKHIFLYCDKT
jgi:hypothetical protein